MSDFYTAKQIADIMVSHSQAVTQMQGAVRQLGDLGVRSVTLWQQATALAAAEDSQASGLKLQARSIADWDDPTLAIQSSLAKAFDSIALAMGVTRQSLLDAIAEQPATFGV